VAEIAQPSRVARFKLESPDRENCPGFLFVIWNFWGPADRHREQARAYIGSAVITGLRTRSRSPVGASLLENFAAHFYNYKACDELPAIFGRDERLDLSDMHHIHLASTQALQARWAKINCQPDSIA